MGTKQICIIKINVLNLSFSPFCQPTFIFIHIWQKRNIYIIVFGPGLATGQVLISNKEKKHNILPTTLNFAVRMDKLCIYTLQNPPEVIW